MNVDRMFDSAEDEKTYLTFNYSDRFTGQSGSASYEYDTHARWDTLLNDFVSFLSGVYGYDIHRYVEINSPFSSCICDDCSPDVYWDQMELDD